ncbi:MAG: hypothetical protein GKR86_14905, partial [Ilumatobacter sp.]|nr:hypothetical protein [Ilumatobacter sp.]
MIDIALAAAFIGLLVASLVLARSIAVFSVVVFVIAGFTGSAVQFVAVAWRSFTLRELQIVVLIGLIAVLVLTWMLGRRSDRSPRAL